MWVRFHDRRDAGRQLARLLHPYAAGQPTIVLGLPRGGVPVGYEVAGALRVPLDAFVVRKLGAPGHEELGLGAIASGGVRVINHELARRLGVVDAVLDATTRREELELRRRELHYRGQRPFPDLAGASVIVVDDGLATGSTMRAAVTAIRALEPARIIVGAPVASIEAAALARELADAAEFVALPEPFYSVGSWYADFDQTTDEEVCALLAAASERAAGAAAAAQTGRPIAPVDRSPIEANPAAPPAHGG